MPDGSLPLDHRRYDEYVVGLRQLVEDDSDLPDLEAVRTFVDEHRSSFGPRTAEATLDAPDHRLRTLIHIMVLAASELTDLHETSRSWLSEHGQALPPWDVTVPRTAQRLITFADKVCGVVEWEPEPRVELDPSLSGPERTWATALAVGIGECPQWSNEEVSRYAAYLVMGSEEFAEEREHSDEELAERYCVPIEAVRQRRRLPDVL